MARQQMECSGLEVDHFWFLFGCCRPGGGACRVAMYRVGIFVCAPVHKICATWLWIFPFLQFFRTVFYIVRNVSAKTASTALRIQPSGVFGTLPRKMAPFFAYKAVAMCQILYTL